MLAPTWYPDGPCSSGVPAGPCSNACCATQEVLELPRSHLTSAKKTAQPPTLPEPSRKGRAELSAVLPAPPHSPALLTLLPAKHTQGGRHVGMACTCSPGTWRSCAQQRCCASGRSPARSPLKAQQDACPIDELLGPTARMGEGIGCQAHPLPGQTQPRQPAWLVRSQAQPGAPCSSSKMWGKIQRISTGTGDLPGGTDPRCHSPFLLDPSLCILHGSRTSIPSALSHFQVKQVMYPLCSVRAAPLR